MGAHIRWLAPPILTAALQLGVCALAATRQPWARPLDALAVVLLLAGPALLLARGRWPVATLIGTAITTAAYYALGYPGGPAFVAFFVAVGAAILSGHRLAAWLVIAGAYAAALGGAWLRGEPPNPVVAGAIGAWLLVVLIAIELFRARKERVAQDRQARAEQAKRRASEERLRIARELHDVLAHHVSLINVQAGTALHLLDEQPELARGALTAIKSSSKEVLVELRAMLGVLRRVDDELPRRPTPGLDRLDELVDGVRASGMPVEVQRVGEPSALPLGVDAAAFRIVQEALTNVGRHAGSARAVVRLDYLSDPLVVEVRDDGVGSPNGVTAGNGIAGMQERARALGGTLTFGPGDGGGFRVRAELPRDAGG